MRGVTLIRNLRESPEMEAIRGKERMKTTKKKPLPNTKCVRQHYKVVALGFMVCVKQQYLGCLKFVCANGMKLSSAWLIWWCHIAAGPKMDFVWFASKAKAGKEKRTTKNMNLNSAPQQNVCISVACKQLLNATYTLETSRYSSWVVCVSMDGLAFDDNGHSYWFEFCIRVSSPQTNPKLAISKWLRLRWRGWFRIRHRKS